MHKSHRMPQDGKEGRRERLGTRPLRSVQGFQLTGPATDPTFASAHTAERGMPLVGRHRSRPSGVCLTGRPLSISCQTDMAAIPQRLSSKEPKKAPKCKSHRKRREKVCSPLVVVPEPPIQLFGTLGKDTPKASTKLPKSAKEGGTKAKQITA